MREKRDEILILRITKNEKQKRLNLNLLRQDLMPHVRLKKSLSLLE